MTRSQSYHPVILTATDEIRTISTLSWEPNQECLAFKVNATGTIGPNTPIQQWFSVKIVHSFDYCTSDSGPKGHGLSKLLVSVL